jgi:hypothetical protein
MNLPTCKTCDHWDFKVETDKAWGRCSNKKVSNSTYISLRMPSNTGWSKDQIYEIREYVRKETEIYFEENTFGCIHHTSGGLSELL